jgi:hypothetical protein
VDSGSSPMTFSSELARRTAGARSFLMLIPLLIVAACAPGEVKAGLGPDPTEVTAVTVASDKSAISVGEAVLVRATAKTAGGSTGPAQVDWTTSGGTLVAYTDSTVLFTSSTTGSYKVRGRGRKNTQLVDSTVIVVSQPVSPIVRVTVSPDPANLPTGGTLGFAVTGTRQDGSTFVPTVTWSATGGTITQGGVYTAGSIAGNYRVMAVETTSSLADTSAVALASTAPILQAVVLTPATSSLATGSTQQFSVSGQWSDGSTTAPSVTYSATGGTISSGGLYTAGSTAGTFRVIATQQGGTLADTSAVTITAPVLQAVILTPGSVSLATGATQQFTVSGQWSNGATTAPSVTYSATGGTITAAGLYTAGTTAGTFRVIAVQQGGTLADTSVVTLSTVAPVLQAVILTPATASLATGATQQFAVSGQWSNGATTAPAVTYSMTGGTISSGGLYTAGSTAGTFRVIATQQGGTLADTSAITITAPVLQAVILAPSTVSLATGASQQFAVSGQWSNGATTAPAVTYSATGGTISSGGLYTAGSTAGTFRVIATQQGGTLSDTAVVTVAGPVLQAVILTPASANLATGATQQFTVSGRWSDGSTSAPAVTWSANGGSISTGGLYSAGVTGGTFRVIATQQGGTLADTSAIILTAPPPVLQAVILTPTTVTLAPSTTQQFAVSGQWSNGATTAPPVTYSATGGTITSGGLYTAGSTTGSFRVIATQQGGTLADTSAVTVATAAPNSMYFNSSETGGDGSNPNYLLADDFEDGNWYSKNCDDANNSGGLLQTDGWCGTIYANPITPANAAVCGNAGLAGTNCAATSGYHSGAIGGRNMASHGFVGGATNLNEAYFRVYFQPQADYVGGHEKMFDFTRDAESGQLVALCYNYFGSQTMGCIPYLHQDDGVQGQANAWMRSNMASTVTLVPTHWYYFEMHVKLNTPGAYDGVFEWWLNDCGVAGTSCTGTPTLRGRYTNVKYRDSGAESSVTLGGIWIENWANEATIGTMYYDNVIASKAQIGFAH